MRGEQVRSGVPDVRRAARSALCAGLLLIWAALALFAGAGAGASLTGEIRPYKGQPALFVDGKLTSSVIGFTNTSRNHPDFLKAGIFTVDFGVPFGWLGPEMYDFTEADALMDAYIKQDRRARFLPRFTVTPAAWWCAEFPGEITRRPDGKPAGMFGGRCRPSFASQKYRDLAVRAVRAFIRHMESKYGDRIIGYFPGDGVYGEWFAWNSYWESREPPAEFGVEDYSAPAQHAFRAWLRRKYGDSVEGLRAAWGDRSVDFESASVPSEEMRKRPHHGIFFDPAVSSRVPDFFEFFNDVIADVLIDFCRAAKEATGRKKVVGAFYGYIWASYPHLTQNHAGHLGLEKVLRSSEVDFIAAPYTYDNRAVGGANNSQTLPESIALHGKLYFNEADTETHLQRRQWRWGESLRNPKNFAETKGLLIRDFGYALTNGFGMWYMDLLGDMFHDAEIIRLMAEVKVVDERWLEADKRRDPEIAVILDEDSWRYLSDGEILPTALLSAQKQWELAYLGAPFDALRLRDLSHSDLPDYKLYVFLNTFRVTEEQRSMLHARFKRNRATAVWVYAPGYIGRKLDVANMQALTGIRLAEDASAGELHVEITGRDHPYTRSVPKGLAYGTDVNVERIKATFDHRLYLKDPSDPSLRRDLPGFRISPRFYAEDAEAVVLGRLAGLNKPGLVVKRQGDWTSVYSSAPILPAALLRDIARAAGCHIYSDAGDVVYANRGFLCVYAPRGGTRTVRLPRAARVLDLLENRTVSDGKAEFTLTIGENAAGLYALQ